MERIVEASIKVVGRFCNFPVSIKTCLYEREEGGNGRGEKENVRERFSLVGLFREWLAQGVRVDVFVRRCKLLVITSSVFLNLAASCHYLKIRHLMCRSCTE